ncbi:MAG: hypothetical protein PHH98_02595 [Candidatus Gracilibacteria bacterium]|nr:hypothetical protein [Candidatus Gracilibacteria bacterium]
MKNKISIFVFFVCLFIFFGCSQNSDNIVDESINKKETIENKINSFSEEEKIIINEKLDKYNTQISNYLSNYSGTGDINLAIKNDFREFQYIQDSNAKSAPTISDFNVDFDKNLKDYENSQISYLFANNKMTFLEDAIFKNSENDIYKYLFINYIELYSKNKKQKISPNITYNTDYQKLIDLDKDIYTFDLFNQEEYIDKYFLLSNLEKSGILINTDFKNTIYNDLVLNYKSFENKDKLLFLIYLNKLGELDNFLTSVDEKIEDLPGIFGFKNNELAYFSYLLSLKDSSNIELNGYIEKLELAYNELDFDGKIMLIGTLSNLKKDYNNHYIDLEKTSNYDLKLKEQFIKFIVFSEFENEYTIFDNYSKFYWSSGMQVNKNKQFNLSIRKPFYYEDFNIDKVIYNDIIDTRVASFFGDKFYLNITLKQK